MASNDTPTSAKERIHSPASSLKHELHVGKGIASRIASKDAMRDLHNMKASLRLLLLVLLVSALMGIAAWAFLASLDFVTEQREAHLWLFALLPVVSVATAWVYRTHGLRAARGNNLVIDSSLTGTPIHARMAGLTFVCSVATHLAGGSAGREGTAVQIGGTIASNVAQLFKLSGRDRKDLMLAGISAAFGGVFGTPLAGAFFGMEMCTLGKLTYSAGMYCLVASFAGDGIARLLGTQHSFQPIAHVPTMTPSTIALVLICAVVFGLTARLFSFSIRVVKKFWGHRVRSYLLAALLSSLVLMGTYMIFGLQRYGGLSEWMVASGFKGQTTWYDPALKLLCTALTLGAGYQGGEVTPLFGIGASLGGWIATITGSDPSFMAALGLLGVFGAALNVPITTIMLGIDMFSGKAAAYFVIVAFVSYLVAGHRGVYPAQRIVTPKRRSLEFDEGETVEHAIERHHEIVIEGEPASTASNDSK